MTDLLEKLKAELAVARAAWRTAPAARDAHSAYAAALAAIARHRAALAAQTKETDR